YKEVRAGSSYQSHYDNRLHFGLNRMDLVAPTGITRQSNLNGQDTKVEEGKVYRIDKNGNLIESKVKDKKKEADSIIEIEKRERQNSKQQPPVGLGEPGYVDEIVVTWPSGKVESFKRIQSKRFYLIKEGVGITRIK
ncbi:ASPIC/UnbV domain-containing protein, partial [bacterium]|nr:ASPIC/UnbV domain-containing protein [bacterium]